MEIVYFLLSFSVNLLLILPLIRLLLCCNNLKAKFVFILALGFPCGSAGKESAYNAGDLGSIPGLGRYSGEAKGYSL